jgi:hypothetical protein
VNQLAAGLRLSLFAPLRTLVHRSELLGQLAHQGNIGERAMLRDLLQGERVAELQLRTNPPRSLRLSLTSAARTSTAPMQNLYALSCDSSCTVRCSKRSWIGCNPTTANQKRHIGGIYELHIVVDGTEAELRCGSW